MRVKCCVQRVDSPARARIGLVLLFLCVSQIIYFALITELMSHAKWHIQVAREEAPVDEGWEFLLLNARAFFGSPPRGLFLWGGINLSFASKSEAATSS